MEIILLMGAVVWLAAAIMLILIKFLAVEAWAAVRGETSPRLLRRQERERQRRDDGVTTVGQAMSARLVRRIQNPPERRWAAHLREFCSELAVDVVAEARARHQHNMWERARRRAQQRARTWQARTGGATSTPRPAPPEPTPADDARLCGCGEAYIVAPDVMCQDCEDEAAARTPDPTPEPSDPETGPIPTVPPDTDSTDRKEPPPMGTITHTIAADVRNPCYALQFSTDCRNFAYAVVGQFDTFGNRQRQLKLGQDRIAAANVLADEIRGYVEETGQSIEAYAKHVRIQKEIKSRPDLAATIDETYLGEGTGDDRGVTPPKDTGVPPELNAADCRTPEDCERFMVNVAACFTTLKLNSDEVINRHVDDGVSGKPIEFLEAQRDRTQRVATKAEQEAARYQDHASVRNDTVGSDPSLHGTQKGKYLNPAGA